MLQAPAMAGAAEAYIGLKDVKRASHNYDDITNNWPDSPRPGGEKESRDPCPSLIFPPSTLP